MLQHAGSVSETERGMEVFHMKILREVQLVSAGEVSEW